MASPLNDTDIERISNKLNEKLMESLPAMLCSMLRDDMMKMMKEWLPSIMEIVNNEREVSSQAKTEAQDYMNSHRYDFNIKQKKRASKYEQFSRCVHILELYDGCIGETPVYIPKKFREEKFHARNVREREVIEKRSLANMHCEYDLLSIRREDFKTEYQVLDTDVKKQLEEEQLAPPVIQETLEIYKRECKKEEEKINKEWRRKIAGVKKSFKKDKEERKKLTQNQSQTNGSSNGSNTYENQITPVLDLESGENIEEEEEREEAPQHTEEDNSDNQPVILASPKLTSNDTDDVILVDETILDDDIGYTTLAMIEDMGNGFEEPHFRDTDTRNIPPQRRSLRIQESKNLPAKSTINIRAPGKESQRPSKEMNNQPNTSSGECQQSSSSVNDQQRTQRQDGHRSPTPGKNQSRRPSREYRTSRSRRRTRSPARNGVISQTHKESSLRDYHKPISRSSHITSRQRSHSRKQSESQRSAKEDRERQYHHRYKTSQ